MSGGGLTDIPLDRLRALREARLDVEALREVAQRDARARPLLEAAQAAWVSEVDRVFKVALGLDV